MLTEYGTKALSRHIKLLIYFKKLNPCNRNKKTFMFFMKFNLKIYSLIIV